MIRRWFGYTHFLLKGREKAMAAVGSKSRKAPEPGRPALFFFRRRCNPSGRLSERSETLEGKSRRSKLSNRRSNFFSAYDSHCAGVFTQPRDWATYQRPKLPSACSLDSRPSGRSFREQNTGRIRNSLWRRRSRKDWQHQARLESVSRPVESATSKRTRQPSKE